jgi:hypothetical protein
LLRRVGVRGCAQAAVPPELAHLGEVAAVGADCQPEAETALVEAPEEPAGFAAEKASHAMKTVAAYVIGVAISEAAWLNKLARSQWTERDWVERLWPSAEKAAQAYPRLRERYAAQRGRDPEKMREEAFGYGLERILDGLETRLSRSQDP